MYLMIQMTRRGVLQNYYLMYRRKMLHQNQNYQEAFSTIYELEP